MSWAPNDIAACLLRLAQAASSKRNKIERSLNMTKRSFFADCNRDGALLEWCAQSGPIQKKRSVGTWKLVSAANATDKGVVKDEAYGRNPLALLSHCAPGRMMALITGRGGATALKYWRAAPPEEGAEAFSREANWRPGDTTNNHALGLGQWCPH